MDRDPAPSFAALVRRYRLAAGLSQEELAERAGLSGQAVGALERGVRRTPYRDTIDRLATALGLAPDERAQLHAAVARPRRPAAAPARPASHRSNLPPPTTSFVGRQQEQATVVRLLASSRLLTLTGSGGVGKTRLASHVAAGLARTVAATYPDGVWLVELAPLAEPALLPQAVAQVLGVRERPGQPLLDTLLAALRETALLLLLDNCEHLLPAVSAFAVCLLRACPRLRILATSRAALGALGETVWWVPSLSLPEPLEENGPPRYTAQSVARAEAAQLFVERATAAHPAFALTEANAAVVAAICRRLDGIPLAIELAAARARILTPEQIAARLDARFRLLTGGNSAVPRHETLRAALDWSYDLLSDAEQRLLQRLSVFAGGCDIEAAEAVCTDDALFDLLTNLVEKSLISVEYRGETARYHMLETVREYAHEKLAQAGEASLVQQRHGSHFLALAEQAVPELSGPRAAHWLARLDLEHDNIRAALGAASVLPPETALRLAIAVGPFWDVRGHLHEGRRWFEALLARGDASAPIRANALRMLGVLAWGLADLETAWTAGEQSLALQRQVGNIRGIAEALNLLGMTARLQGRLDVARAYHDDALALQRAHNLRHETGTTLTYLGLVGWLQASYAEARAWLDEAATIFRQSGNHARLASALINLGNVALEQGAYDVARASYEEALPVSRGLGDQSRIAVTLNNLGVVAQAQRQDEQAGAYYRESLAIYRAIGELDGVTRALNNLGLIARHLGDADGARAYLEESLVLRRRLGLRYGIADSLHDLAALLREQGSLDAAQAMLAEALTIRFEIGDRKGITNALSEYAVLATDRGWYERAARLFGAESALRAAVGVTRGRTQEKHDRAVAAARTALGDAAFEAAWAAGAALSVDQAVAEALTETAPHRPSPTPAAGHQPS